MQAPLLHVSYKEYYRRFFRQFLRDLFELGSEVTVLSDGYLNYDSSDSLWSNTSNSHNAGIRKYSIAYAIVVFALCVLSAGRVPAQIDTARRNQSNK